MKTVRCLLLISLLFIFPVCCVAQSGKTLKEDSNFYRVLHSWNEGTPIKVVFKSGQVIKGRFHNRDLYVFRERYLEVKQNNVTHMIAFSDIKDVKVDYNVFQKIGRGFQKVGIALDIALLGVILGIDWLIHGGKVNWELYITNLSCSPLLILTNISKVFLQAANDAG